MPHIPPRPLSRAEIAAEDRRRQAVLSICPDLIEDDEQIADDLSEERQRARRVQEQLDLARAELKVLRRHIDRARDELPRHRDVLQCLGFSTLEDAERFVATRRPRQA